MQTDGASVFAMSISDDALLRQREQTVTCPTCRAATPWQGNAYRPFCSLTCRLIDLGAWLDEGYRVPADEDGDVP
jgi:endogenous inhibitor of DNA gyrase (YacG/DUF329 family)